MRIEDFDIISYLDKKGIPYLRSGDNVSKGWIGISCLYCTDHANHLGINLARGTFSCLRCHETGNVFTLVKELEGFTENREVFKLMEEFCQGYVYKSAEKTEVVHNWQKEIKYPVDCSKKFWPRHLEFLQERRYDPEKTIEKYNLQACGPIGDFSHRIIIPIYFNNRIISFVGRDITGLQEIRYKNAPDRYGTKPTKDSLYGLDKVHNKAIVVEGVLDAWRLGDGAVATFGTKYTDKQVRLLKGLKEVFVCFDQDAVHLAKKLAFDLSTLVRKVEVLELPLGDPDNLSDDDAKNLKKLINF